MEKNLIEKEELYQKGRARLKRKSSIREKGYFLKGNSFVKREKSWIERGESYWKNVSVWKKRVDERDWLKGRTFIWKEGFNSKEKESDKKNNWNKQA